MKLEVNENCIACGACQTVCDDICIADKAIIPDVDEETAEELKTICPMGAIE